MGESKVLIGREKICQYLGIGKEAFYKLIRDGMPAKKRGDRWVAHVDLVEEYFKKELQAGE